MAKFEAGVVAWATDPTEAHQERPIIILSHKKRPWSSVECTVMCLGHSSKKYNHRTPELESKHLTRISFNKTTYVMPWAIYTIPPGSVKDWKPMGELTTDGKRLVQREFVKMLG